MDNVVIKKALKKISFTIILFCSCVILLTGCFDFLDSTQVRKKIEKIMECIKEKDENKLFEYFSEYIRDNRKEETMEEIHRFFIYINGKIVSYEYNDGGMDSSTDRGETLFYCAVPDVKIKTDTGKKYIIQFTYLHKWVEYPDREGLCSVLLHQGWEFDSAHAYEVGGFDIYD